MDGFSQGFDIGYRGSQDIKQTSKNLRLQNEGDDIILWNKVMKEVRLKRFAGPYEEIPFDDSYIQSPIGLVPKDNGRDTRLIFHLSYPRGSGLSLNENTPKELCSVQYPDFQKAVELCIKAGIGCRISKSDMTAAFRNLGIRKRDWRWLILKAKNPKNKQYYYFIDKCLPFGASISCALFQRFSNAISHIVKIKAGNKENINYLDDFLFIALLEAFCNGQVELFLRVCSDINFPVSAEKTFYASTRLVFLGLLLDMVAQLVLIPAEKIAKAKQLIDDVLDRRSKKITIHQLQKICGFLNFLGRCVVPRTCFHKKVIWTFE